METIKIYTDAIKGFTDEQFYLFCIQNKELRIERDSNKQIYVIVPTFSLTGYRNAEILYQLTNWNKNTKLGYCFDSSTDFTLPNKAMRSPDAAWICKEKWEKLPQSEKDCFAGICPDFVIELRSSSDNLQTLQSKMAEWVANGCKLAWLIDFEEENITIYHKDSLRTLPFDQKVSGLDVLPGFELDMREI